MTDQSSKNSTELEPASEEFDVHNPESPRNGESELVGATSTEAAELSLAHRVFVLEGELKEAKEVIGELERRLRDQSVLLVDPEEQEVGAPVSGEKGGPPQGEETCLGVVSEKTFNYFRKWKGEKFYVPEKYPTIRILLWSFIGAFFGIAVVSALHSYWLSTIDKVGLIGSMGAAAILLYGTQSPLAQPRNVLGGNVISALVGVSLHYAFASVPDYTWIGDALAVAISLTLMQLTKTVHPPAGATALIFVSDSRVWHLGFLYVVVPVIFGFFLMVLVALIIMNIKLRYPKHWV